MRTGSQFIPLLCALCFSVHAFDKPPVGPEGYSRVVGGLCARLTVSESKVAQNGSVEVFLELRNMSDTALQIEMDNPEAFRAEVLDDKDKAIASDLGRSDVLSSPKWVTIPARAYIGIPVTIGGSDGQNLDITTDIWKLKPGKYQIRGQFSSKAFADLQKKNPENAWSGKIKTPAIAFEITK